MYFGDIGDIVIQRVFCDPFTGWCNPLKVMEHRKPRQKLLLLTHLLQIGNGLFIQVFDTVTDQLFITQKDQRILHIVKDPCRGIEQCVIRIESRFTDIVIDQIQSHSDIGIQNRIIGFFQQCLCLLPQFFFLRFGKQHITCRNDLNFLQRQDGLLRSRIKEADTVDLIVEELDSYRLIIVDGIDIDDTAACRKGKGLINMRRFMVSPGPQLSFQLFHLQGIADPDRNAGITEGGRHRQLTEQAARTGHNDLFGVLQQGCQGFHLGSGHLRTGCDCLNPERFIRAEKRTLRFPYQGCEPLIEFLCAV